MPSLGASDTVSIQGTSTAFTNAPTTKLTANTVYQITDATKRLIDPAVAVLVEVDADGAGGGGYATAAASSYVVDYLFGRITFAADQGSAALVRVSASYLPVLTVAEVTEWSFKASRPFIDNTSLDSGGVEQGLLGRKKLTGSIKGRASLEDDLDPGGGTQKLTTLFESGLPVLFQRTAGGKLFRAWTLIEGTDDSGQLDGLLEHGVNFVGAGRIGSGQTEGAMYGWEP